MTVSFKDVSKQGNSEPQRHRVVIVGGGLAGIAAASALSSFAPSSGKKFEITLLESRPQLGGRATSYVDRETGETIDNCQHVSMGCCTNLRHLCRELGIDTAFQTEEQLEFIAPDGRRTSFKADRIPAPFHLTRAFLKLPYLTWKEKRQFATAVRKLARASPASLAGKSFSEWLREQGQPTSLIQNVWEVVLVSALSESTDRIDAAYARKVFVDGFLAHPDGWKVEIPKTDLDDLYSHRTKEALNQRGVQVRSKSRAVKVDFPENRAVVSLTGGDTIEADDLILAVPHHQLPALISDVEQLNDLTARCEQIETAPITSVHLWYDRPLTDLPHAVLIGRLSQWMFNRGEREVQGQKTYYYQVVISASRNLKEQSQSEATSIVDRELREIWSPHTSTNLMHSRMITERRAVFSVTPGIDKIRPPQQTGIPQLQVAGDWTQTGWPATMEGAVISGYLAAENVCRRHGAEPGFVQSGLPVSNLTRWLFGLKK